MMKTTLLCFFCLSSFLVQSQDNTTTRPLVKNNVVIDAYIGGPQLLSQLSSSSNTGAGFTQSISSSGTGPFGGRIEYMFTPKSSIGLEINHATSKLTATWNDNYDKLVQEITLNRTRVFPRYALHFGKNKLDAYWHIGLGIAIWSVEAKTTDPSNSIFSTSPTSRGSGPVLAFRTGVGLRYFFTKNLGVNLDMGLGGALLTGGVSVKF